MTQAQPSIQPTLVVIGNFDGVHRGHQELILRAWQDAQAHSLRAVVLTFDPHPAEVLGKGVPARLSSLSERVARISALAPGLEVKVLSFTSELAELPPEDFTRKILREQLGAERVWVGENFRFGGGRSGDFAALQKLGYEQGFVAEELSLLSDEGGPYSSSRIRARLSEGRVEEAERLLGRPYSLQGRVTHGDGRGRSLGFPTANLEELSSMTPADGVYVVGVDGAPLGSELALGLAHLGLRPTFERSHSLEVHLLGRSVELYGEPLQLHFWGRLRGTQKFSGLEALVQQIRQDLEAGVQLARTQGRSFLLA